MLRSSTRATIIFSVCTASFLIAAITTSADLFAFRVKSFRKFSSQHSSSCMTFSLPSIFVASEYSCHRVVKYDHASLDSPAPMMRCFTFSTLCAGAGVGKQSPKSDCLFFDKFPTLLMLLSRSVVPVSALAVIPLCHK